jgi:hypothetical protein
VSDGSIRIYYGEDGGCEADMTEEFLVEGVDIWVEVDMARSLVKFILLNRVEWDEDLHCYQTIEGRE